MADRFREGDHLIIDDRSGKRIYASESRKEWNGLIVHKDDWEPRHPQDFVRARPEAPPPENVRPRPVDTYIGPLCTELTAGASAGATSLTVTSTARMAAGDRVSVILDNGDTFRTTIATIDSTTILTIASPLPWASSAGRPVIDNTAISAPTL